MQALTQLCMGFSLAAVTGLRASLPLFAASLLARYGVIELNPSFSWLASTQALTVFGAAVLFELLGDKFPAVDHLLDAAGVLVKPVAATVLGASLLTKLDPVTALVLGAAAGGATAAGIHLVKGKTRLVSSLATLGIANPLLSVLEDILAAVGMLLSILIPLLAALLLLGGIVGAVWMVRRLRPARS